LAFDLTCDTTATTLSLTFTGETKEGSVNSYNFKGATKYACPGTGGGGGGDSEDYGLGQYGAGGLILTLLLVAFILYFVIGTVLLKFKFQKTGLEMIPQGGFWKDLPFLFFDGIMLPVDLIKGAMGKGKYQEMA